ncbi:MAG: PilZ domain-containing protein [Planctomycetota bacterium]|nr:PilZ domain-containing protein [Planctomycetota bacterium]
MLNDSIIGRKSCQATPRVDDRRDAPRTAAQVELLICWHFQPDQKVRYRSLDLSEFGVRIRSSTPLLEGMTGVLVSTLPEGERVDRPVMVVWSRTSRDGLGHEAGLRYF